MTVSLHSIDIWRVEYSSYSSQVGKFWVVLSPEEKKFSLQFLLKQDQDRYIITRGILRRLISTQVGVSPHEVQLSYTSQGKPIILHHALTFNVSHSRDQLFYAFSNTLPIGIDIEYTSSRKSIEQLAKRYFSLSEQNILTSLNKVDKEKAFYLGWVQKEAITKALGYGLNLALRSIEVPLYPLVAPTKYSWEDKKTLLICPIETPKNFIGALAVDVKDATIEINYQPNFSVIN